MALPDYIQPGLYINNLNGAIDERRIQINQIPHLNHPKVNNIVGTGDTNTFVAMGEYACNFQVSGTGRRPGLNITAATTSDGSDTFIYIPQQPNNISIGYLNVPSDTNTHIYSDNFGGCAWHMLSRNQDDICTAAFLHIYQGKDTRAKYQAEGWETKAAIPVKLDEITKQGLNINACSLAAYAFIAAGSTDVDTCILILDNYAMILGYVQHRRGSILPDSGELELGNPDLVDLDLIDKNSKKGIPNPDIYISSSDSTDSDENRECCTIL